MHKYKELIDGLVDSAVTSLASLEPTVRIITDDSRLYDARITLKHSNSGNAPDRISLSYDEDAGYFLDIDNETLEFQKDEDAFQTQVRRYVEALRDGKLVKVKKKLFKVIDIGEKVVIRD